MMNKLGFKLLISVMLLVSLSSAYSEDVVNTDVVSDTQEFTEETGEQKSEELTSDAPDVTEEATGESSELNLAKIDVSGVADELKKNIELHMPVTIPECNADRGDVKQFFNTVKKNLLKASRALGYYDAEFTSGGSIVDNCWNLRLKVTPGRVTKVIGQEIRVVGEGKNEKVFKTILEELPYKVGDNLNHQLYTDFKTKLSEATQTFGYFDAEFEQHSISIDPSSFQAKIALVLNTGPRFRYGDVSVQQTTLTDKAIGKYLILKEGQPFKAEELINQQQLLQRSGYYKTIKIEVLHEQIANNRVPVSIQLEPKKRNAYKFKVGFGSDTGARVSAELNRRWTGSKGRQLQIKTQYAQTLSGVSIQLANPRENPDDNSLVYNIDWYKDSNDDVVGRSINIGAKVVRKNKNGWIRSASINAMKDRTQVTGENETDSRLLLFGVGLEKVSADNLLFPSDGWRLRLGLSAAADFLFSDQNVLQLTAQAKRVVTVGSGKLLGRANFGTTVVNDFERLPKSLRFFAGGGKSVRGHNFESLGVRNDNDRNRGGKQLIDLSLEYQHPVIDDWSAAVFVDAGNAFDDIDDIDLEVGVGFGARWRSPVGPVRIDVGFPIDDLGDPKLYLSVGSDL